MSTENTCGDYKPSLMIANYKLTAAQFDNIKASWNDASMSDGTGAKFCIGNNWWDGSTGGIGASSCPNCGSYTWGGSCGCTLNPYPPTIYPTYPYPTTYPGTSFDLAKISLITKGKGKADILGDFFGPEVHALVVLDDQDGGARFIPFMDKLNMIWLQETLNSWAAYDRDEFLEFVNSEEQTIFVGDKLKKEEVLKRMMKPEKAPENLK